MVTSRVVRKEDACILEINGKPVFPYGYMSYQPEKADCAYFRALGVRLLFLPVYAGDRGINPESGTRPLYPGFWIGPDEYDFSAADMLCKLVLGDAKPGDVLLIPRLMIEPPSFWEKAHPDCLARDQSGAGVHQCYSSRIWLDDTVRAIGAFCDWLKGSGFDAYTAGIQIAAGHTEEFMRPITHPLQMTDYSECSLSAWRHFLEKTYGTAEALSSAWGFPVSGFDKAPAPTPAQRIYTPAGSGHRSRQVSDYYRFHSEENANALIYLAGETKRLLGGDRVVGGFFGYCGAERGHTALDLVLESPNVDFLASPFSYAYGRPAAGDWVIGGPVDSCALHGKLWFMECDVRTHLSRSLAESMPRAVPAGHSEYYSGPIWLGPDEETSVCQLKKALAKDLSHGLAQWWFDMWGGWYRSDSYRSFHAAAKEIYERELNSFRSSAQTAVILDLQADEYETNAPDRTDALHMLAQTGVSFRQYVLTDLPLLKPESHRALILINLYRISEEQKHRIAEWLRDGRSVIALNCPALAAPDSDFTQPVGNGSVSVCRNGQFYSFPAWPEAKTVREALLAAGAHVYSYTDDVIYACRDLVAINAVKGGDKRIYLPRIGSLTDAFSGEKPVPCEYFTDFTMREGETRLFRIEYDSCDGPF